MVICISRVNLLYSPVFILHLLVVVFGAPFVNGCWVVSW